MMSPAVTAPTATPPPATAAIPTVAPTPEPVLFPTLLPSTPSPLSACAEQLTYRVDPALADTTARANVLLGEAWFGCLPFKQAEDGVIVVEFSETQFEDDFWYWVLAAATPGPGAVYVNQRCWDRVTADWASVLAHELGHNLGWSDLSDFPYMELGLMEGEHYRDDLVIVCGP